MNAHDRWSKANAYGVPQGQGHPYSPVRRPKRRSKWAAGLLAFFVPGIGHMYLGRMTKGISIMLLLAANITAIVDRATVEPVNVLSIVLLSLLFPIIYFYSLFDAIQSTDDVNEKLAAKAGWQSYPPMEPHGHAHPPEQPYARMQSSPYAQPEAEPLGDPVASNPNPLPQTDHDPARTQGGWQRHGEPDSRESSPKNIALLAVVVVCIALLGQETWSHWKIDATLSIVGAVLLIGGGVALWLWEIRGSGGHKP